MLKILAGLFILLMGGPRSSRGLGKAGHKLRPKLSYLKWLYHLVAGGREEQVKAEAAVGADLAAEFLKRMPLDLDHQVQTSVQRVGRRLSGTQDAQGRQFDFQVVQGLTANAYALPGSHVFATQTRGFVRG